MARFRYDEADKYGGSSTGFFSLKEDKDTAKVRFMYNGIDDMECFSVHELQVEGEAYNKQYVNCLREAGKPISVCPFCESKMLPKVKLLIPLYDVESGQIKFWDRGKKFINKMSSICSRYSSATTPLCSHVFEIERNGKKGEQTTTYEVYETDKDNTTLEDLPEVPEVFGTHILDKSADDMAFYVENGYFPPDDDAPVRRTSRREEEDERPTRRTPGNRRYGA